MSEEREALVVCSDYNVTSGITVWDLDTGEELSHRPTCASPRHGLVCLANHFLAASQLQKPGSYPGGAIFMWALNKSQVIHRSYPVEPIGPLACTVDGAYLAGGTPSGKIFMWEVASGKLLQCWSSHRKSVTCLRFSDDDSLLISGGDDGLINVWLLIRVLDATGHDLQGTGYPTCLHSWADHTSSISDLATLVFSTKINAVTLDPGENLLFLGTVDGTIFVTEFEIRFQDHSALVTEDQTSKLTGHKGAITALTFSLSGLWLISASEDCTARVWDTISGQPIRIFEHKKGQITNIIAIPQSFVTAKEFTKTGNRGSLPRLPISTLEKSSCSRTGFEGPMVILPSYCSLEDDAFQCKYQSKASMKKQIVDLEQDLSPEAIQLKVETSVEQRSTAADMVKHLIKVNKTLQSKFVEMVQSQLSSKSDAAKAKRRKHLNLENA